MKSNLILTIAMILVVTVSCGDNGTIQYQKEVISLDNITSGRPYSPAIKKANMLFVSGQVAVNPETGQMIEGGIEDQTIQVLNNMKAIIGKAGFEMEDVVKCTVLLTDISFYGSMNSIYSTYFPEDPPARKAFAVKDLPLGALVEIDAVAIK
ncbi:MAG TPA: Rid family detoxifying hydrolase [Bacteroidales bacterium]|nr:Rid family detoxifying hydrolase [Bacteroidales bacterium]